MPPVSESFSKPLAAPERSLMQRMEALQRANDIRSRRAQLKRDLKAGRQPIHELLLEPPEYLLTAKVFDLLLAVPKYGRVKVNRSSPSAGSPRARRWAGCPSGSGRARDADAPPLSAPAGASGQSVRDHRPSGVGKGTLIRGLLERVPELELSVSATTRAPRPGERSGHDYHFMDAGGVRPPSR